MWYFAIAALMLVVLLGFIFINDIFPDPGMRWTREEMREMRKRARIRPTP